MFAERFDLNPKWGMAERVTGRETGKTFGGWSPEPEDLPPAVVVGPRDLGLGGGRRELPCANSRTSTNPRESHGCSGERSARFRTNT